MAKDALLLIGEKRMDEKNGSFLEVAYYCKFDGSLVKIGRAGRL